MFSFLEALDLKFMALIILYLAVPFLFGYYWDKEGAPNARVHQEYVRGHMGGEYMKKKVWVFHLISSYECSIVLEWDICVHLC